MLPLQWLTRTAATHANVDVHTHGRTDIVHIAVRVLPVDKSHHGAMTRGFPNFLQGNTPCHR